jgi:hypothetical protein
MWKLDELRWGFEEIIRVENGVRTSKTVEKKGSRKLGLVCWNMLISFEYLLFGFNLVFLFWKLEFFILYFKSQLFDLLF